MQQSIQEPLVSIVVGSYNERPGNVHQLISSILNQTYTTFELIIVDDSDKEESISAWKHMASTDKRIRYVNTGKRQFFSKALNQGLKIASGDFIARIDSDDVMYPERLALQVEFLTRHHSVDIVGSAVMKKQEGGREIGIRRYAGGSALPKIMMMKNGLAHSTVMFRRTLLSDIGYYDETIPNGEDYELWMRALNRGKTIDCLPYVLVELCCPPENRRRSLHWKFNIKTKMRHFNRHYLIYRVLGISLASLLYIMPPSLRKVIYKIYNKRF